MLQKLRIGKEVWGLLALFVVFLACASYYETADQEHSASDTPSAASARKPGAKAFYLLLKDPLHYRVDELKTTWNALGPEDRLLVVIEPMQRAVSDAEMEALRHWVEEGGVLLYLVSKPPRDRDPKDRMTGDIAVIEGDSHPHLVAPAIPGSPYTRDVQNIEVASPVRLEVKKGAGYQKLFVDSDGALALHKAVGKGHVLIVSDTAIATNATIGKADNAVFLVNVASEAVRAAPGITLFDEYHHGIGFEVAADGSEGSVWQAMPLAMRLALWQALGLCVLLIWNGAQRFGSPRPLQPVRYRPTTDYVGSMARLYRRAGAADLALITLYKVFLRDLARRVDAPADARASEVVTLAERQFPGQDAALLYLLSRCEQVDAGQRITPAEALTLTQQLEHFRRRFDLVGN